MVSKNDTTSINTEIKSNQRGYRYHIISQHMRNNEEKVIFTSSNKEGADKFISTCKGIFPYRHYIYIELTTK